MGEFEEFADPRFKHVATTDPFLVPQFSVKEAFLLRYKKYLTEYGGINEERYEKTNPSTPLVAGTIRRIKIFRVQEDIEYDEAVGFIKGRGGFFPNAIGLLIGFGYIDRMTPDEKVIYGIDEQKFLCPPCTEDTEYPEQFPSVMCIYEKLRPKSSLHDIFGKDSSLPDLQIRQEGPNQLDLCFESAEKLRKGSLFFYYSY
jgi:hypothetical protein